MPLLDKDGRIIPEKRKEVAKGMIVMKGDVYLSEAMGPDDFAKDGIIIRCTGRIIMGIGRELALQNVRDGKGVLFSDPCSMGIMDFVGNYPI